MSESHTTGGLIFRINRKLNDDEMNIFYDSDYYDEIYLCGNKKPFIAISFPRAVDPKFIDELRQSLNIEIYLNEIKGWVCSYYDGCEHPLYNASWDNLEKSMGLTFDSLYSDGETCGFNISELIKHILFESTSENLALWRDSNNGEIVK